MVVGDPAAPSCEAGPSELRFACRAPPAHARALTGAALAPMRATRSLGARGEEASQAARDATLLAAVRRQMEVLEEKIGGQVCGMLRQADRLREAAFAQLEEKVLATEALQPRLDRRLGELTGSVRGVSEELQAQARRTEKMDSRLREWCRVHEEDLRKRHLELEEEVQRLSSTVRQSGVCSELAHTAQRQAAQRLARLEDSLADERRAREAASADLCAVVEERARALRQEAGALGAEAREQLHQDLSAEGEERARALRDELRALAADVEAERALAREAAATEALQGMLLRLEAVEGEAAALAERQAHAVRGGAAEEARALAAEEAARLRDDLRAECERGAELLLEQMDAIKGAVARQLGQDLRAEGQERAWRLRERLEALMVEGAAQLREELGAEVGEKGELRQSLEALKAELSDSIQAVRQELRGAVQHSCPARASTEKEQVHAGEALPFAEGVPKPRPAPSEEGGGRASERRVEPRGGLEAEGRQLQPQGSELIALLRQDQEAEDLAQRRLLAAIDLLCGRLAAAGEAGARPPRVRMEEQEDEELRRTGARLLAEWERDEREEAQAYRSLLHSMERCLAAAAGTEGPPGSGGGPAPQRGGAASPLDGPGAAAPARAAPPPDVADELENLVTRVEMMSLAEARAEAAVRAKLGQLADLG